jgi:hypothetical protein
MVDSMDVSDERTAGAPGTSNGPASAEGHGAGRVEEQALPGRPAMAVDARLTFDGRAIGGREGEPLLAALLAEGIRVVRTMPKTGEARGGYCLVGRCTDCLVVVDGRPNVRACLTPLRAGMRVDMQVGPGPAPTGGNEAPPHPSGEKRQ